MRRLYELINAGDIDGRAREHWGVVGLPALLQQLGALPAAPPA